jgi:hypothetical protein
MINFTTSILGKRGVPFALAMAVFLAVTIPAGIMRPLWYDELASRWFGEAASLGDFVNNIRTGVEPTPPLYLITQYLSIHLLGWGEWAGRFPSMVGYGVSLTFLYLFVARRLDAIGGAIAMAIMILSGTIYYAQETRPYGLVFGCAALAMWSWQMYIERGLARHAALCVMALFTAGSLHYYAVLLSVPFGMAELVRIWQRRRIDWKILLAVAAPGIALLIHLPLIRMILGKQSNPAYTWNKPAFAFPAKFWLRALEPGVFVFVGVVILLLYLWRSQAPEPVETKSVKFCLPDAELALLIGFVLIPITGTIFAKLVTNAISPRYVFSAVLGFSALSAHLLARVEPAGRVWVFLLLLAAGACNGLLDIRWMMREPPPGQFDMPAIAAETALPVVVDDYLLYATLGRYAPPEVLSRLIYLTDDERFTRYTKAGQMELGTVAAVKQGQLRGQSGYLVPFLESHSRFLLFEPLRPEQNESWLSHALLDRGVELRLIAIQSGGRWYLGERK